MGLLKRRVDREMGESGMFALGQLVEKRVERQENMALWFIDFEKA